MFDIGGGELLLILIVVLVAFGPKKLPELAQSLGRGIREFKRAQRDFAEQINSAIELEQQKQTRTVGRNTAATAPAASGHPALESQRSASEPITAEQQPMIDQPAAQEPSIKVPMGARTARGEMPPLEPSPVSTPSSLDPTGE